MKLSAKPLKTLSDAERGNLALGLFEEKDTHAAALKAHPALKRLLETGDFKGKANDCVVLYPESGSTRLMAVGLGKRAAFGARQAMEASATAVRRAGKLGVEHLTFALPSEAGASAAVVEGAAEGARLGTYAFDRFKEKKEGEAPKKVSACTVAVSASARAEILEKACHTGAVIGEAQAFVRDLAALPSNFKTPTQLGEEARKMARKTGLSCHLILRDEAKKLGMGAFLGVAQGSAEPPVFVVLEHKPAKASGKAKKPVVVVGKGITFDTGGISLKPALNMHHMKDDMTGGAIVLGLLKACAELELPTHVVGLVPFTENMPGGKAQKPGDIVYAMNGKTIEVINTDAEGRLVLADALCYAERYKPAAVVDLATLTGAAGVALGRFAIGAMATDQRLVERLQAAGEATGERVWQLPLWDEYLELMRGEAADLLNTSGGEAGTITAGSFLKEFAKHSPWCHLDIAASAWGKEEKPWSPKGPTGNGLRMMVQFLRSWR